MTLPDKIISQYSRKHLYSKIIDGLLKAGKDLDTIKPEDLWPVDQFHVGGAESSIKLADQVPLQAGQTWLDAGCGIGGVCRMLAGRHGIKVTGVDLTPEYIDTAKELTDLVGMSNQIQYELANALDLPYQDQVFDGIWTQHVQMNLKSKQNFYNELNRVLKPGGYLVYHDLFQGRNPDLTYPTPWSDDGSISYLVEHVRIQSILHQFELKYLYQQQETSTAITFFEKKLDTNLREHQPELGLHLLMGSATLVKLWNVMENLKNGSLEVYQAVLQK